MTIGRGRWATAFLIALLAHWFLVLALWEPKQSGAANMGVGGMDIAFGMAGGAPGASDVPPPQAETVEAAQVSPVEATELKHIDTAETVAPVEVPEVTAIEPPVADADAVAVPKAKPTVEKKVVPPKPAPPKQAKIVAPKPVADGNPDKQTATNETLSKQRRQASSIAGSAGKTGTQQSANVGNAESTSSGGRPGSANGYFAMLQAQLEAHKEYPSAARMRRNEGTAVLTFTISRNGEVDTAHITKSSGWSLLDTEVLNMIARASPLPPFPDDFRERQITLSVPIRFSLKGGAR